MLWLSWARLTASVTGFVLTDDHMSLMRFCVWRAVRDRIILLIKTSSGRVIHTHTPTHTSVALHTPSVGDQVLSSNTPTSLLKTLLLLHFILWGQCTNQAEGGLMSNQAVGGLMSNQAVRGLMSFFHLKLLCSVWTNQTPPRIFFNHARWRSSARTKTIITALMLWPVPLFFPHCRFNLQAPNYIISYILLLITNQSNYVHVCSCTCNTHEHNCGNSTR